MSRTASPVVLVALLLALASPLAAQQDSQRPTPAPRATEQPRTVEPRREEPRRVEPRRDQPQAERPAPQREQPRQVEPRQVEPRQREPRSTGEPELRRRKPE